MPISTHYSVKVILRAGEEIKSPSMRTEEEAKAAIAEINRAKRDSAPAELDWIAVNGADVLVASIQVHRSGSVGVS